MQAATFFFQNPQGTRLFGRFFPAPRPARVRGTILCIHGYSEHSGFYTHLQDAFHQADLASVWMDLPGQGRSEGRRADIDRFQTYLGGLDALWQEAQKLGASTPVALFGHSLGGLIALRAAQELSWGRSLAGLALTSPLLGLAGLRSWHHRLLHGVTRFLPNLTLSTSNAESLENLSRDREFLRLRGSDPLVKQQTTIRWVREFLAARRAVWKDIQTLTLPIALFLAGDERVVSNHESRRFFEALPSASSKVCHLYPEMRHEILNDFGSSRVIDDLLAWLEGCLPSRFVEGFAPTPPQGV